MSVLIVSETFATERQDNDIQGEDESVEVHSIGDHVPSDELSVDSKKRSKKSNYPGSSCPFCEYNEQRPTMGYNPQHRPVDIDYSLPPKTQYQASAPVYSPPSYNPPNYSAPNYNVPNYNAPNYNAPNYNQPSYYPTNYNPTNYNPSSYNPPSYQQSAYNSYINNKHPAPVYPSPSNLYPQHPHQPRHSLPSSNLLVGCHPHVSPVADTSYLSPTFVNSPPYGQPHNQQSYRFGPHEDSSVSASIGPDFDNNEKMPERIPLLVNVTGKADNAVKTAPKNEINDATPPVSTFEEAKVEQQETMMKMAQFRNQMAKKTPVPSEEKPKKEPSTGKNK